MVVSTVMGGPLPGVFTGNHAQVTLWGQLHGAGSATQATYTKLTEVKPRFKRLTEEHDANSDPRRQNLEYEQRPSPGLYADRAAGRHRHHRDPSRDLVS